MCHNDLSGAHPLLASAPEERYYAGPKKRIACNSWQKGFLKVSLTELHCSLEYSSDHKLASMGKR